jgi:hypothetical protein
VQQLGRRERDVYRHNLSVYFDKIQHGEIEGLKLLPSKMPLDKYLALLDFLELDLYELMAPPQFDPASVDTTGLTEIQAATKVSSAKAATDRSRQELFFIFDNFSRARQLGVAERVDFQQNLMAFIRVIGHLGDAIERWAELTPMSEEEIQDAMKELETQGRRAPQQMLEAPGPT